MIEAGKTLFADRGFAGASVRDICKAANASSTMIHHYFGNKQGLFDAILQEFTDATFDVPMRLIAKPAKTQTEYKLRLEMFIGETFRALVSQADVFRILVRERKGFVGRAQYHASFQAYLKSAQDAGFLNKDLQIEMVTGLVLDRLGNQILYAATTEEPGPNVLTDDQYADEWLTANIALLLHGLSG